MKTDIDKIRKMELKEFLYRLRNLEAVLAEERYIFQRQIDNHLLLNSPKTINNFKDIYTEFSDQMDTVGKIKRIASKPLTQEEIFKKLDENARKMGFKVGE